jgi:hypothetical protein
MFYPSIIVGFAKLVRMFLRGFRLSIGGSQEILFGQVSRQERFHFI